MLVTDTEPKRLALLPRQRQNYVGGGSSGLSAGASGRGFAVRPLLRGFSTADAWWELFFANACSSLSAFCLLTSFSTARVHLVFTPMNNSRRSMRLQAEHKNVWCSNPGSVVESAGTASINTQRCTPSTASLLVLHQWAHRVRDDQAGPRRECALGVRNYLGGRAHPLCHRDQLRELLARVEHARLHSGLVDSDSLGNLFDRYSTRGQ